MNVSDEDIDLLRSYGFELYEGGVWAVRDSEWFGRSKQWLHKSSKRRWCVGYYVNGVQTFSPRCATVAAALAAWELTK